MIIRFLIEFKRFMLQCHFLLTFAMFLDIFLYLLSILLWNTLIFINSIIINYLILNLWNKLLLIIMRLYIEL